MKCIGLTGGIGAGKSLISNIFELLKICVYNSDLEARRIMQDDKHIRKNIVALFGEDMYTEKKLNSEKLASIVFKDRIMLERLNAIVHPVLRTDFMSWSNLQKGEYVLNEAAILIESGAYKDLDGVILVKAPENIRIKRVVKRDTCSEAEVKMRINCQMSDEERATHCQWTIINDEKSSVLDQVLNIHKELIL